MNISYAKDCRNNYLVLEQENTDVFPAKMLERNSISGFLKAEIRYLDGVGYLYYNISGKQSLSDLFDKRPYDSNQFEELMWDLGKAIEQCEEYFLPIEGLSLNPQYVFYDLGDGRWEFLYIPCNNRDEFAEERIRLAEFLALHGDPDDEELNRKAYAFYEDAAVGKLVPWNYVRKEQQTEGERIDQSGVEIVDSFFSEPEEPVLVSEQKQSADRLTIKAHDSEPTTNKEHNPTKKLILLGIVFTGAAFISRHYSLVALVLFSVAAMSCIAIFVKTLIEEGDTGEETKPKENLSECICGDRSNNREEKTHPRFVSEAVWDRGTVKDTIVFGTAKDGQETDTRTVYIEQDDSPTRLCGEGRFGQWRIELESLPITIGKDSHLADYTLSHASVSRLHAKLFEEGGKIYIQDMNSTNGTYRNGIRLNPNEKTCINRGDEVEIGRVLFVCR